MNYLNSQTKKERANQPKGITTMSKKEQKPDGEIIKQTFEYPLIAASFSHHKDLVGDIMLIPKVLIVDIIFFKEVKEK
jgi:hypothetical protein